MTPVTKKTYDRSEIKTLKHFIQTARAETPRPTFREIAERLNQTGIPHLSKPKWTSLEVGNFVFSHITRSRRKAPKQRRKTVFRAATAPKRKDDRIELATLVLASSVGEKEKIRMLGSLFAGQRD